jgi:FOG: PKD repeat
MNINNLRNVIGGLAILLAFSALPGCTDDADSVSVKASFETDKEVYEVYEDIVFTNTTEVSGANLVACKWEWNGQHIWSKKMEPISFDVAGEYPVTLTAVCDVDNIQSVFTKTIKVVDTNVKPVADFEYSPLTGIRTGEPVQFTDKSSDADGQILAWEWTFGSTVVTEQNPLFTFNEFGSVNVTLKVIDNKRGVATKSVTIDVAKGANALEKLWECPYDEGNSVVYGASPALAPDGKTVYGIANGYKLAAVSTADGALKWKFDASKDGAAAINKSNEYFSTATATPSVDADGTIFIAVGHNELKSEGHKSSMYAVGSDGSQKWRLEFGWATFNFSVPAVTDDCVIFVSKENPSGTSNFMPVDKNTGLHRFAKYQNIKTGSYGGTVILPDGRLVINNGGAYGTAIFHPQDDPTLNYKLYGSYNGSDRYIGWNNSKMEDPRGAQIAVNGKYVYCLYRQKTGVVSNYSVLYCIDTEKINGDVAAVPEWVLGLDGDANACGVVCGEDGTLYVTTCASGADNARVTAVSPDGQIKWTSLADGDISGVAAVDNEGFIYYNDYVNGKLVKIKPADGVKVSEITLGMELRSSPTIGPDGTVYLNGMDKSGKPALFAVRGSATGPADCWSQIGGNPCKTCRVK